MKILPISKIKENYKHLLKEIEIFKEKAAKAEAKNKPALAAGYWLAIMNLEEEIKYLLERYSQLD